MKNHSISLQFSLWLVASVPLSTHAAVEVPYWLQPEWMAAKVIDFHTKNAERLAQSQKQEKNKTGVTQPAPEQALPKPKLAPLEEATPHINEKQLSKEELHELRKQLKQKL